jgi:hypothetical protein
VQSARNPRSRTTCRKSDLGWKVIAVSVHARAVLAAAPC